MIRDIALSLAVAVLPVVVTQLGEGVREAIDARRRRDRLCDHGFPGGRLCVPCAEERAEELERAEERDA